MSVTWREDRKKWMIHIKHRRKDEYGDTIDIVHIRETCKTKRGAERRGREITAALEAGTWKTKKEREEDKRNRDRKNLTLASFAPFFIKTYAKVENKPSEIKSKQGIIRRYLIPILGQYTLNKIDEAKIGDFKAAMVERELSNKTINNALAVLSKMLRFARERKLIDVVPLIKFYRPGEPYHRFFVF